MLTKFISVLLSLIMSVTGLFTTTVSDVIDTVSEMIYGIPYTYQAVKSDFFEDIDSDDIVKIDDETGYVKDKIVVFVSSDITFSEKLDFFANCGGIVIGWCAPADLYVLSYPSMKYDALIDKCEKLEKYDEIELSVPVTAYKTDLNYTPAETFGNEENGGVIWDELSPQGNNWWLEAIDARSAWDYSDYFSNIKIGVLDTGVQTNHPELSGKITFPNSKQTKRNVPDMHGTHVSGIITAKHNGVGITGVCDNAQLVCVDWTTDGFQFWNTDLAIFFGFSDLVKAGAKVINLSLGTSGSKVSNSTGFIERIFTNAATSYMMASLLSKGYDFIAVQSAGNGDFEGDAINAENNGHFAAITEDTVFVGSTGVSKQDVLGRILIVSSISNNGDGTFTQSYFSNVGNTVTLAAPGEDIYSSTVNGEYCLLSGTSMSAPIVSAVTSLVWSVNPSFTGAQVKEIVCTSYDSVAQINTEVDYYYSDLDFAEYPVVNAKLAVEEAVRRTYSDVGYVTGIVSQNAHGIVYNEKTYTVYSDGSFSFLAKEGVSTANLVDEQENILGSFELEIVAGQTTVVDENTIII